MITGVSCGFIFLVVFIFLIFEVGLGFIPTMFISAIPTGVLGERLQKKFKLTAQELAGSISLAVVIMVTVPIFAMAILAG